MANITREISIDASVEAVWDAVRDVGAVHCRLVPGLVIASHVEGDIRIVTFANGLALRELIVDIDDGTRRLVYASIGGRAKHHQASMQALAEADGKTRLVWITDIMPAELADQVRQLVDAGAEIIKVTLAGKR